MVEVPGCQIASCFLAICSLAQCTHVLFLDRIINLLLLLEDLHVFRYLRLGPWCLRSRHSLLEWRLGDNIYIFDVNWRHRLCLNLRVHVLLNILDCSICVPGAWLLRCYFFDVFWILVFKPENVVHDCGIWTLVANVGAWYPGLIRHFSAFSDVLFALLCGVQVRHAFKGSIPCCCCVSGV